MGPVTLPENLEELPWWDMVHPSVSTRFFSNSMEGRARADKKLCLLLMHRTLTLKNQVIYPWSPSRSKRAFPGSQPKPALHADASAGPLLLLYALSKQVDITSKRISCFEKSYKSSWPDTNKENWLVNDKKLVAKTMCCKQPFSRESLLLTLVEGVPCLCPMERWSIHCCLQSLACWSLSGRSEYQTLYSAGGEASRPKATAFAAQI